MRKMMSTLALVVGVFGLTGCTTSTDLMISHDGTVRTSIEVKGFKNEEANLQKLKERIKSFCPDGAVNWPPGISDVEIQKDLSIDSLSKLLDKVPTHTFTIEAECKKKRK